MKVKGLKEFQEDCKRAFPNEHSGQIYLDKNDFWCVISVKTIPTDFDHDGLCEGFTPDKTDWYKKKKMIIKNGGIIIGVIHSHPRFGPEDNSIEWLSQPSEMDLKLQRKYKHLVRGIVVCNKTRIFKVRFHDARNKTVKPNTCPLCGARLK